MALDAAGIDELIAGTRVYVSTRHGEVSGEIVGLGFSASGWSFKVALDGLFANVTPSGSLRAALDDVSLA